MFSYTINVYGDRINIATIKADSEEELEKEAEKLVEKLFPNKVYMKHLDGAFPDKYYGTIICHADEGMTTIYLDILLEKAYPIHLDPLARKIFGAKEGILYLQMRTIPY